jgi:flagellar protein FliJ
MNTFRFRLQPVLDLRANRQEQAQKKLADSVRALQAEEERLTAMYQELSSYYGEWNEQRKNFTDINDVRIYQRYLGRLERNVKEQMAQIRRQEQVVNGMRAALIQATKDKKIMERLKDKRYQEFLETINKLERNFMDEIASRGAAQARTGGAMIAG